MYLIVKGNKIEYPFDLEKLRKAFPNISFGKDVPEDFLNERGVYTVQEVAPPEGKKVKELTPILVNGIYTQQWEVSDFTQVEIDQIKLEEIKTIKQRAFLLLKDSTWFSVDSSGIKNSKEWSDFRKALGDILKSPDPTKITFPALPEVKL